MSAEALRWLGLSLDLLGIILVAAEDLAIPLLHRATDLATAVRRGLVAVIERWRGKSVDAVVQVAGGGGVRVGGYAPTVMAEVDPGADVESAGVE